MGKAIIIPDVSFASKNLGVVTPLEHHPLEGLTIISPSEIEGDTYQLGVEYDPVNTDERGVVWSIESGDEYASINASTGLLTIFEGASAADVVVKVTSTDNTSISATKTISVTKPSVWDLALADSFCSTYMAGKSKAFTLPQEKIYDGQQESGDAYTQPISNTNQNYLVVADVSFGDNIAGGEYAPALFTRLAYAAGMFKNSTFATDTDKWHLCGIYSNNPSALPLPSIVDGSRYKFFFYFDAADKKFYVKNLTTGDTYTSATQSRGTTLHPQFYLGGGASNVNNFKGTIHEFFIGL